MSWKPSFQATLGSTVLCAVLCIVLSLPVFANGTAEITVTFERAELTGRWVDSWEEKGVVFKPAHSPKRSKAKARLMFFPHDPSKPEARKGILSAMANDPIPVRIQLPQGAKTVIVTLWGSTGCPARLEAFDSNGTLVDTASRAEVPGREAPGDPIPLFDLTVKGEQISYVEFSGPRAGEFLAASQVRIIPAPAASTLTDPAPDPSSGIPATSKNP